MRAGPGRVAAAVLLPPLGVYLHRGPGRQFAIACGMTVLGFLPGVGYALITLFKPEAHEASVHRHEPAPVAA
jgi:uncharacterized membrane protein YqaE (UPF0057 family)